MLRTTPSRSIPARAAWCREHRLRPRRGDAGLDDVDGLPGDVRPTRQRAGMAGTDGRHRRQGEPRLPAARASKATRRAGFTQRGRARACGCRPTPRRSALPPAPIPASRHRRVSARARGRGPGANSGSGCAPRARRRRPIGRVRSLSAQRRRSPAVARPRSPSSSAPARRSRTRPSRSSIIMLGASRSTVRLQVEEASRWTDWQRGRRLRGQHQRRPPLRRSTLEAGAVRFGNGVRAARRRSASASACASLSLRRRRDGQRPRPRQSPRSTT